MPEEILLNPESEEALSAALEREHIRPAYTFQGKELWNYSNGSDLVFQQVCDDGDLMGYRGLAFVFIHLKRTEKTAMDDIAKYVIPIAWDLNRFRSEIMRFREKLTPDDVAEASRILVETLDTEMKSRVKAGAPNGEQAALVSIEKKTELTPETSPIAATS